MAIWSDIAEWIGPSPNEYPGAMGAVSGVVLHIQEGTEAGTEAWQKNPASQVSSHFLAPRAGDLRQMIDTASAAWAEVSGNLHWLSIECEGYSGQPLTGGQIEACAQVLARAHAVYGVPLAPCDDPLLPGMGGLTGHGLGGSAWGGHTDCPGAPILAQRGAIIDRAAQIAGASGKPTPGPPAPQPEGDDDMSRPVFATGDVKPGTGAMTLVLVPPANYGSAGWGDVWFSLGSANGDAHVRVSACVHGAGWRELAADFLVPDHGDRANPAGGPLPTATQKIAVWRLPGTENTPLSWLIEAATKDA